MQTDKYFPVKFDVVRNRGRFFFQVEKNRRLHIPRDRIISIEFAEKVLPEDFGAMQIVLLACLIAEYDKKGYSVHFGNNTQKLRRFFAEEIYIHLYLGREKYDHVVAPDESVLNLWRVVENRIIPYSKKVHEFLKTRYFTDRDLSAFEVVLLEMYCNVFDHALADGVAFSYVKYHEITGKISVAVCDFGQGIAHSLRPKYPVFHSDKDALVGAFTKGVSARTKSSNRGMGLDDVVSFLGTGDTLRIASNRAFCFQMGGDSKKVYDLYFDFRGTLLYFDISIQNLEKEDFVGCFSLEG